MKHFCSCTDTECPCHPVNQDNGCDPCIQKNLQEGEIPSCFWNNVRNGVKGATPYSAECFSEFCLEQKGNAAG